MINGVSLYMAAAWMSTGPSRHGGHVGFGYFHGAIVEKANGV